MRRLVNSLKNACDKFQESFQKGHSLFPLVKGQTLEVPIELRIRAILTYVGLSLAILLVEWTMRSQHYDSLRNPAWRLISAIYRVFESTWWFIAAICLLFIVQPIVIYLIEIFRSLTCRPKTEVSSYVHQQREAPKTLDQERIKQEEAQYVRLKAEAAEAENTRQLEEHFRRIRRTPDEAIETAFQNFIKGR